MPDAAVRKSVSIAMLLLALPFFASAQILHAPSRTLQRGDTGQDVTYLQEFLAATVGFSTSNITGYYGILTQSAVQTYQKGKGIVSSGTPETTGYGKVGPLTLAAIQTDVAALNAGQSTGSTSSTASSGSGTAGSGTGSTGAASTSSIPPTFTVPPATPPSGTGPSATASVSVCQLAGYSNTANDAAPVIQRCFDDAASGSIVELPAGVYRVFSALKINKPLAVRTQGKTVSGAPCALSDSSCAQLVADANWTGEYGMLEVWATQKVHIDHIVFNGNKNARRPNVAPQDASAHGRNLVIMFEGCTYCSFSNNVFKDTLSATGLGFFGNIFNTVIYNNIVANSGYHELEGDGGRWADGLTVSSGNANTITYNTMIDNTDVDFIIGGCTNCKIMYNTVKHTASFKGSSFAALMFHAWVGNNNVQLTSGDYLGSEIAYNTVECNTKRCGFGMYIGVEAWSIRPTSIGNGSFHDNIIKGAQQGIHVDSVVRGTSLYNNSVNYSGGTFYTNFGTRTMGAYNIAPGAQVDRSKDKVPDSSYTYQAWTEVPNWAVKDPLPDLLQQAGCTITAPSTGIKANSPATFGYTTTGSASAATIYAPYPTAVPDYGTFTSGVSGSFPVTFPSSGTYAVRMDVNNNVATGLGGYGSCVLVVQVGAGSGTVSSSGATNKFTSVQPCAIAAGASTCNVSASWSVAGYNHVVVNVLNDVVSGAPTAGSVEKNLWIDQTLTGSASSAFTAGNWRVHLYGIDAAYNATLLDYRDFTIGGSGTQTTSATGGQSECSISAPVATTVAGISYSFPYTTTNGATVASAYSAFPATVPGYGSFTPGPSGSIPITFSSAGTYIVRMDVNNNTATGNTGYKSCQTSVTVASPGATPSSGQATCTLTPAAITLSSGASYNLSYTTSNGATAASFYAPLPTPAPGYASFTPASAGSLPVHITTPGTHVVRMDVNNNAVTGNTGFTSCSSVVTVL